MSLVPGITKEYAKSTEARRIARKEQEESGWKKHSQWLQGEQMKIQKLKLRDLESPAGGKTASGQLTGSVLATCAFRSDKESKGDAGKVFC